MDWKPIQQRLGVIPDGQAGRVTYAALLGYVANRTLGPRGAQLGKGCAEHLPAYWIDTPLRLAHWTAQASHETMGFLWLREIWGPTAAQRRYEGREDLGNTIEGDGRKFLGRGIFQLTGRSNYQDYGQRCGVDLACNPEKAEDPELSVHIACEYWKAKGMNAFADADDCERITRRINGGLNGFAERLALTERAKGILL